MGEQTAIISGMWQMYLNNSNTKDAGAQELQPKVSKSMADVLKSRDYLLYDPRDTNKNGIVDYDEQIVYDLDHPEEKSPVKVSYNEQGVYNIYKKSAMLDMMG